MPSKNSYHLINPSIEGSMQELVKASSPRNAAKKIYNNLSEYFSNHMEEFYMTVMDVESKKLSHFQVREKRSGNQVDFYLEPLPGNLSSSIEEKLIEKATKPRKQKGGRSSSDSSDSDSSSSSSSDMFLSPISKFTYFYLPYHKLFPQQNLKITKIFTPILSLPVNPTIEIDLELYVI